jgi:hypothetical protein
MASIKLGSIASDIRGSIGGTVFSRNGGGAYAKQRVKGTDPNTPGQQLMRSVVSSMIAAWSAVSATVRTNWGLYAAAVTLVNRLGDPINVSGYNMYTRTRSIIERLGMSMPAAAPTTLTLAEQDPTVAVTADASDGTLSVAFDNTLGWAGEVGGVLIVAQSPPQNATVNSYKGPFKIMGSVAGAVVPPASPASLPALYTMVAGQKVFTQFRVLRADGRLSTPFRTVSTVVA